MKRLIWLALLALILCGCGEQPEATTTVPTESIAAEQPTEPTGCYAPDTEVEILTGGAIRSYFPDIPDCYGMSTVGADVLVFSGTENTTLTRLAGDSLYMTAQTELNCLVKPEDSSFQVGSNGITYYDTASREVVFLDHDLKVVSRVVMPEDMVGMPVLSANRLKVYYCTADAVRMVDLEAGLDRLLKTVSYPEQGVTGLLHNDTVVQCTIRDEHDLEYSVFISAETGQLLWSVEQGLEVTCGSGMYYASRLEGTMVSLIFGEAEGEAQMLIPADPFGETWYLELKNAAVSLSRGETAANLAYYDLRSGLRTASAELPGELEVWYARADAGNDFVYLMGREGESGKTAIWRWEPTASACEDNGVYTSGYWTEENPDGEGLRACAEYAAAIGQRHGVEILLGSDAVASNHRDFELEMEYQVPVILRELEKLEGYLANFPEGFFEKIYGNEKICLVRAITGSPVSGKLDPAMGIQYWQGENSYVVLAAGESLEQAFYHNIFHLIDNRVLSATRAYYKWDDLNPEKFEYDVNLEENVPEKYAAYLEEETRAFVDSLSMTSVGEDRAQMMMYACMEGNESYFTTEIMQKKLKTLCKGIRESFGLKDYPDAFVWEQYLEEPLTP